VTVREQDDRTADALASAGHAWANLVSWLAALLRAPRVGRGIPVFVPSWQRNLGYIALAVVAAAATMVWVDTPAMEAVARLPLWVVELFRSITNFGRSGWFLFPLGLIVVSAAFVDALALDRWSRVLLASIVVRAGFLFVAIGLPGLIGTIAKRLIGRVRPSALGPFAYEPLSWRPDYASFPSGHAITAFGVLVAFGAVFPRLRPVLWIYAIAIAVSRVVVSAHFPSDVVAGGAFGAIGAMIVRDWFAVRRLGFYVASDGDVHAFAPLNWQRLKRVARRLFAS
jgi:membrane-associated phospholipid phosphatase